MAYRQGTIGKLIDTAADKLAELLGALAPQPEAIPIPIHSDRPRR